MAVTLRQKVIMYLLEMGYKEIESKSKKYRAFKPSALVLKDNPDRVYFVGSNGAVRVSNSGNSSDSVSITETFMKVIDRHERGIYVVKFKTSSDGNSNDTSTRRPSDGEEGMEGRT